ncbi:hypothetical protein BCR42DRAFT_305121, partial [Absidia repens]
SFFFNMKGPLNKRLLFLYFWAAKSSMTQIELFTGLAPVTIRSMRSNLYYALEESLDESSVEIGGYDANGERIIVEVDESKFGKVKYHRGHPVEGVWVVGGVEKTADRKMFVSTVENRNGWTMKDLIIRFVKPGSI